MKKILYVTNLPAPYKVLFFNLLSENVDLTVVYEREKASNRDDKWKADIQKNYKEIYLKGKNVGTESAFSTEIINILKTRKYDIVLMNGYSSPTAMLAIFYMKMFHIKYGIVCDGMLPTNDSFLKKQIKTFFIKNAHCYLSSGELTDQQLIKYGASVDKIFRYPFSSISKKDIVEIIPNKDIYKKKIGCNSKKMLLYVGQFIERKGIDLLFESIINLDMDFQLYMVGGTKEEAKKFLGYDNDKIVYCGFKTKEELADYYKAADYFVLPTREDIWGLVVNEALAYGVPVITTKNCGAGIELIKKNFNGYIVEFTTDILKKILDSDYSDELCLNCVKTAQENTIEMMAIKTIEFICTKL